METLLGLYPPLRREAWHRLKGWYWDAVDHALPPARVTLKQFTGNQVDLYSYMKPPGENLPISVETFSVDDSLPTEDDIEWAVTRLRNHRSGGGGFGMRAKHPKGWLAAARKNESEEAATNQ